MNRILVLLMVLSGFIFHIPVQASEISINGVPVILEGDRLSIDGVNIRLYGIDAPEFGEICSGNNLSFDCGLISRAGLMDLVAGGGAITCTTKSSNSGGDMVAQCRDGEGFDLSAQMLYTGWATAIPDLEPDYRELELKSRAAGRGMWRTTVTP